MFVSRWAAGTESPDETCHRAAIAAGWTGAHAFIATTTESAVEHVVADRFPWVRADRAAIVFESMSELLANTPRSPVATDMTGAIVLAAVLTGATSPTARASSTDETCNDWTTTTGTGRSGLTINISPTWFSSNTLSCAGTPYVYCLED